MHQKRLLSFLALSSLIALPVVFAADKSDPVEAREAIMTALSRNMKAMGAMAKGEQPFDAAVFANHAKVVANEANKDLVALFPAGSDEFTDAKPEIWQNMDDFKARAAALKEKANALAAVSATRDKGKMLAAQGELGKVCEGCHQKYKAD